MFGCNSYLSEVIKIDNNNKYYPINSNDRYYYIDTRDLLYPRLKFVVLDKYERKIYKNMISNKLTSPSDNSKYIGYKNQEGRYVWCNKETVIDCNENEKFDIWFDNIIMEVILKC